MSPPHLVNFDQYVFGKEKSSLHLCLGPVMNSDIEIVNKARACGKDIVILVQGGLIPQSEDERTNALKYHDNRYHGTEQYHKERKSNLFAKFPANLGMNNNEFDLLLNMAKEYPHIHVIMASTNNVKPNNQDETDPRKIYENLTESNSPTLNALLVAYANSLPHDPIAISSLILLFNVGAQILNTEQYCGKMGNNIVYSDKKDETPFHNLPIMNDTKFLKSMTRMIQGLEPMTEEVTEYVINFVKHFETVTYSLEPYDPDNIEAVLMILRMFGPNTIGRLHVLYFAPVSMYPTPEMEKNRYVWVHENSFDDKMFTQVGTMNNNYIPAKVSEPRLALYGNILGEGHVVGRVPSFEMKQSEYNLWKQLLQLVAIQDGTRIANSSIKMGDQYGSGKPDSFYIRFDMHFIVTQKLDEKLTPKTNISITKEKENHNQINQIERIDHYMKNNLKYTQIAEEMITQTVFKNTTPEELQKAHLYPEEDPMIH